MFFDKKLSKSSDFYYLKPGIYPSFTDIVEAIKTLVWEKHNHSENCITVKVSRRTQKVLVAVFWNTQEWVARELVSRE